MRATAVAILCLAVLVVTWSAPAVALDGHTIGSSSDRVDPTEEATADRVRIVEVAPNPVAPQDRGEHVVISFPEPTFLGNWSIDDGETSPRLPNETVEGWVAVSEFPEAVVGNDRVVGLDGRLRLSNAGETIRLRRGNETVATVRYGRAPEGDRYVPTEDGWTWRPAGASDFPVSSVSNADVQPFALPGSPNVTFEALRGARDRVLLAGYTFESARVVRILCSLRERNVDVRVLVEREPVGGLTTRAATRLNDLDKCGVQVRLLGGDYARYPFHHAKYAIVDQAALVLSENWKASGAGGRMNRGWGVLVQNEKFAHELARVFQEDASWHDTGPLNEIEVDPVEPGGPPASERYEPRFESRPVVADRVDLIVSPDNAENAVVNLLDDAERSIAIQQVSIGSRDHPFVNATLRAARRGVQVRVLLSRADYTFRENLEMVEWLNEVSDREGLTLEARLVEPRSRFGKVHVKGVIADDTALVGSLNWNTYATTKNREVAVLLHDAEVTGYYHEVFTADWRGGVWQVPVGALAVTVAGVLLCFGVTRRWQFAPRTHISPTIYDGSSMDTSENSIGPYGPDEAQEDGRLRGRF